MCKGHKSRWRDVLVRCHWFAIFCSLSKESDRKPWKAIPGIWSYLRILYNCYFQSMTIFCVKTSNSTGRKAQDGSWLGCELLVGASSNRGQFFLWGHAILYPLMGPRPCGMEMVLDLGKGARILWSEMANHHNYRPLCKWRGMTLEQIGRDSRERNSSFHQK